MTERRKQLLAKLPEAVLIAEARKLEALEPLPTDKATLFAWMLGELFRRHGVTLDKARFNRERATLGAVSAALAQIPALAAWPPTVGALPWRPHLLTRPLPLEFIDWTTMSAPTADPNMRDFDDNARKIIRHALDIGWKAKRSRRNHMLLYAPDGTTTSSVPRNLIGNRACDNAMRPIRAWEQQRAASDVVDQAAPASPGRIIDTEIDQPAPVTGSRRTHSRSVGA